MTTSGYQLRRISEPEAEALALDEVKGWLNLDADITEDDETIEGLLIPAARELVEKETSLVLVDSIFEMQIDEFPCSGEIRIPVQPLISVMEVRYIGNDGEYATLDSGDWIQVADEPPVIRQNWAGNIWPSVSPRPGGVLVTFRAGFESAGSPQDATRVPAAVKLAMRMLIAHWYEHREAVSTDHRNTPTEIQVGFQRLLDPYRRII